jgi:hypothetical protein
MEGDPDGDPGDGSGGGNDAGVDAGIDDGFRDDLDESAGPAAPDDRALTLDLAAAAGVAADPARLLPLFDLGPALTAWSPGAAADGRAALRVSVWTRDRAAAAAALERLAPELRDTRARLVGDGLEGLGLALRADGVASPRWWALARDGEAMAVRARIAWSAHAGELERLFAAAGGPWTCAGVGVDATAGRQTVYVRLPSPEAASDVLELARLPVLPATTLFWTQLLDLESEGRPWPELWASRSLGDAGGWKLYYFLREDKLRRDDADLLDLLGAGPALLMSWQLLRSFAPGPWVQLVALTLPDGGPPSFTVSLALDPTQDRRWAAAAGASEERAGSPRPLDVPRPPPAATHAFAASAPLEMVSPWDWKPPSTESQDLSRISAVCEVLPRADIEAYPQLLTILRDPYNDPGAAHYAGPGTGAQGDVLLAYRDDAPAAAGAGGSGDVGGSFDGGSGDGGSGDNGGGDDDNVVSGSFDADSFDGDGFDADSFDAGGRLDNVYRADATGAGAPAVDLPMLAESLRRELGRAFAAQPDAGRADTRPEVVPAAIACRCGARYSVAVANGPLISLRPAIRQQILDGTFHRCFCRACGMTTIVDALLSFADVPRRQWFTVAPSTGLPWRARWLAVARASFEAALSRNVPELVVGRGQEMTRRLLFGLAPLREALVAADAGLDDRIIELLKIQLVRDLRDRLSATDYFHLVAATPTNLVFERTHPDGLIRKLALPRALYDALAEDPELPRLVDLAFPDGLLVDHRALLVPEAAPAPEPAAAPP